MGVYNQKKEIDTRECEHPKDKLIVKKGKGVWILHCKRCGKTWEEINTNL